MPPLPTIPSVAGGLALTFAPASGPETPDAGATSPPVQRPAEPVQPDDPVEPPAVEPDPFDEPAAPPTAVEPADPVAPATPLSPPEAAEQPPAAGGEAPAAGSRAGAAALAPGTRPWFFTFSAGQSHTIHGAEGFFLAGLRLEEAIGTHSKRRGSGKVAGAIVFQQRFDTLWHDYVFGPRLQWDAQIGGLGVYLSPSVMAAYNLRTSEYATVYVGGYDSYEEPPNSHHGSVQFALEAKIIVLDRLLLSFRPVNLDVLFGHPPVVLRWDVIGGLGVTF